MKFNEENLKKYISLQMDYAFLKKSDLYKTDLKSYINKSVDYLKQIKSLKI